jgi:hypothetical protein
MRNVCAIVGALLALALKGRGSTNLLSPLRRAAMVWADFVFGLKGRRYGSVG